MNREKTRTHLINDGFNRYSLNSKDDLPPWFLDDEEKHYKPNIPVTKEAVAALRAKMRALDARPIKKVAEAKARKKFKAAQRLEKAMKKAEGVNETSDMTEREKAKQIEKLMQKGAAKKQKRDIKVVVAKGSHKGLKGRPKGVKGRYVMVDSRMKKEVRSCTFYISRISLNPTRSALRREKSEPTKSGNGIDSVPPLDLRLVADAILTFPDACARTIPLLVFKLQHHHPRSPLMQCYLLADKRLM